jgi:hypothetical protein
MQIKPYIIYLDTSFIVNFYESVKSIIVPVRVVKKTNVSGAVSGGFVSGGATMEEEKEFPIPSMQMYNELFTELQKFPLIDLEKVSVDAIPELFWIEGVFGGQPHVFNVWLGNRIQHGPISISERSWQADKDDAACN